MSVVGIDLGTTNTVVASVRAGKVHVLADERGERLLPSVVSFHPNGEVLVGSAARARRIIDPKNTISSHKRLIGRAWGSPEFAEARQRLTFELREGPGQAPVVHARGKTYTLPEISAFVLKRARQLAETALGEPVTKAVITVPAHFNELQRASTKSAGRISGLDVLRILNEPTAAALAYGLGRTGSERVAVYDFGGGTFDCTLLNLNGNVFEVLATAGDTFLGGDDVDVQIAERMADTLLRQQRVDVRTDASLFGRMRAAAEEMKIALSTAESHTVLVSEIAHGVGGSEISFGFTMTRKELDELAKPLLDRTFKVTEEALALARLTPTAFDKVLLVGGSTRIPAVRARVESYFGRKPLDRVNPDEVVSIGAAIQAAALNEGSRRKSIPPPPGVLSAQPRPSSPGTPAAAPSSPSSQSLLRTATDAGRAALLADVARRAPRNKATNPGLGAVSPSRDEEGTRPRAKSFTNEVPGGVFGAVPDLPIVASDPSSTRGAAPTTPDATGFDPLLDLPAVKAESDPKLPAAENSFDDLPAVKADRGHKGGEEITATFTLEETREGRTLASKTLPGGAASQPAIQRTQRMAPFPSSDTTARGHEPKPAPSTSQPAMQRTQRMAPFPSSADTTARGHEPKPAPSTSQPAMQRTQRMAPFPSSAADARAGAERSDGHHGPRERGARACPELASDRGRGREPEHGALADVPEPSAGGPRHGSLADDAERVAGTRAEPSAALRSRRNAGARRVALRSRGRLERAPRHGARARRRHPARARGRDRRRLHRHHHPEEREDPVRANAQVRHGQRDADERAHPRRPRRERGLRPEHLPR